MSFRHLHPADSLFFTIFLFRPPGPVSYLSALASAVADLPPGTSNIHDHQHQFRDQRPRYPDQSVSGDRKLVDLSRSHPRQCGELDHGQKLRFQRRRGPVHLHCRLQRGNHLSENNARARLARRRQPDTASGLATLRRLSGAVRDLHRLYRIDRGAIRRTGTFQRVQCLRPDRPSDPNPGPWPFPANQGAQPRCAAALHHPADLLRAGAVDDVAPARAGGRGIACAVFRGAPVRLELAVLSGRRLVLQPILLAVAVHLRRLDGAWPPKATGSYFQVTDVSLVRGRLPGVRPCRDLGRAPAGIRKPVSAMAAGRLQSQRQDQPGALSRGALRRRAVRCHPIFIGGLARTEMACS